jgi:ketosteroid isomerase-like protein
VQVVDHRLVEWGDTALLTGLLRLLFTRPGERVEQSASSWLSQVWRRTPAGWQLVSLQSTREAAP